MTPNDNTPSIHDWRLPPWMDASFVLTACGANTRIVSCPQNATTQLIEGNPRRWALIVSVPVGGATNLAVSPFPDGMRFTLYSQSALTVGVLTLFQYGPLITYQWFARPDLNIDVRVTEIELT